MKRLGALLLLAVVAVALAGCLIDPATGERSLGQAITREDELAIGREEHPRILRQFGGAYADAQIAAYVNGVGQNLAKVSELPELAFTFTVLNSPIVNAFALPGGYVYVTRGLLALAGSEAELASVLAHEIGHVTARHAAQRHQRAATVQVAAKPGELNQDPAAYVQGYSRDQELEADTLGIRYLARAGYDPQAMSSFLKKLDAQARLDADLMGLKPDQTDQMSFTSTHPRTADRVEAAAKRAGEVATQTPAPPQRGLNAEAYLKRIDGILYGDDPEQGFVNGRTFSHPGMRISFEAPQGASLTNTPQAVIVRGQNLQSQFSGGALQGSLEAYANNVLRQVIGQAPATQIEQARRSTINGLEAVSVLARAQTQQGQVLDVSVVAYRVGDRAYHFVSITPQGGMNVINPMTASFRQISAQEAAALRPRQISLATVGARDTAQSLANRMAFDDYRLERFLALNGLESASDLRAGQTVKLVTYAR